MKLFIDTRSTRNANAGRGVGQYTRMLIEAMRLYSDIHLVDSTREADVVHYPFFDLFFLTLPVIKPRPTVVTIHDVIPLLYPREYPKGIRGTIKQYLQTASLRGVSKIVTDSQTSTTDVIKQLHQPEEKVETVYLAADPRFSPASNREIESTLHHFGLYQPYLLYVGDINYNKNLPDLFTMVSRTKKPIDLVMVSKAMSRTNPAAIHLWNMVDDLGIGDRLRVLTDVPYDDLTMMRSIYSAATWYVQPSLYEGFGLPILEAQACGCPVITSMGGSLAEVAGKSCLKFDLSDTALIESDRAPHIELGFENLKRFSWKKTAEQMTRIYQQCAR